MNRRRTLLALVIALSIVIPQAAGAVVYLSGQVFRKTLHTPVAGATVSLLFYGAAVGAEPRVVAVTQTLQNGSFVIKVRTGGKYSLSVEAPNYAQFQGPLTLSSSGFRLVDVPLEKQPTLELKVMPVPGQRLQAGPLRARLWIAWKQWDTRVESRNGAMTPDGNVELPWSPDIPAKDVRKLFIEVESEQNGCGEIHLNGWREEPQKVKLQPGRVLTGQVFNKDGKPAANAMVFLVWTLPDGLPFFGPEQPDMIRVGADGHFSVRSLFPRPYYVLAFSSEDRNSLQMPDVDSRIVTPGDGEAKFSLSRHGVVSFMRDNPFREAFRQGVPPIQALERVDPDGADKLPLLSGRVIDQKSGAPIKGAALYLTPVGDHAPVDIARTADDGTYRLRAVPTKPGKYLLKLDANEYFGAEQPVTVPAAGLVAKDLALERRPLLLVKPVDSQGKAIIDKDVQTWIMEVRSGVKIESVDEELTDIAGDGTIEMMEPRNDPEGTRPRGTFQDMLIAVRSEKHGYGEVRLKIWPDGPVALTLQPGAALSCLVVDAGGKPAPGTYVTVRRSVDSPATATIQKQPAAQTHEPAPDRTGKLTKPAPPGQLHPIAPAPPAPAPVLAAPVTVTLRTDAAGRFEVSSLPSGRYEIMCYSPGQQYSTSVTLTTGKTELTLHPVQQPPATTSVEPRPTTTVQRRPAVKK